MTKTKIRDEKKWGFACTFKTYIQDMCRLVKLVDKRN